MDNQAYQKKDQSTADTDFISENFLLQEVGPDVTLQKKDGVVPKEDSSWPFAHGAIPVGVHDYGSLDVPRPNWVSTFFRIPNQNVAENWDVEGISMIVFFCGWMVNLGVGNEKKTRLIPSAASSWKWDVQPKFMF